MAWQTALERVRRGDCRKAYLSKSHYLCFSFFPPFIFTCCLYAAKIVTTCWQMCSFIVAIDCWFKFEIYFRTIRLNVASRSPPLKMLLMLFWT